MESDYIYIFCIPSTVSRIQDARRFDHVSVNDTMSTIPPLVGVDDFVQSFRSSNVNASCVGGAAIQSGFGNGPSSCPTVVVLPGGARPPRNRPLSATVASSSVNVPEDRAPFPARRRHSSGSPDEEDESGCTHSPDGRRMSPGIYTCGLEPGVLVPNCNGFGSTSAGTNPEMTGATLPPYSPPVEALASRCRWYAPRMNERRQLSRRRLQRCPGARRSGGTRRGIFLTSSDDDDKQCCTYGCCLRCVITVTTFRWILLFFAAIGSCCIASGIVLGALHMSVSSSFLTLSIMFIGMYWQFVQTCLISVTGQN